jgi:hypothetical protein
MVLRARRRARFSGFTVLPRAIVFGGRFYRHHGPGRTYVVELYW